MNFNHVVVTVDVREKDLISNISFPFMASALEIGDIHIVRSDIQETFVFERKTFSDLAASIKDGRYKEQKQRLHLFPNHRVVYLLEEFPSFAELCKSNKCHGLEYSTFISSFLSLSFRDGFHVIVSKNLSDTISILYELAKRLDTNPEKLQSLKSQHEYEPNVIKSRKKENITPDVCYQMQLCQIPGISMKIAKDIFKLYPTLSLLMDTIKEKKEHALLDIPGIGKKKSLSIISFLV